MTTYYKGNNIGLTFDGTGWSFNNLAQDFIDTDTFSSQDVDFPYYEPPAEEDEEEREPCPEGYVYDEDLRQCVPDPRSGNPYMDDRDSDANTTDNTTPFPNIEQYQSGVTGGRSYVPTVDTDGLGNVVTEPNSSFDQSGIDYNIFNYSTLPSAMQSKSMNEFMLISYGVDKGYLAFDDEKNAYRKVQFKESITPAERNVINSNWGVALLSADNYRNYKDYFDLLENGYKKSSDENIFKKFFSPKNNLDGNMIYTDTSTRGGRQTGGSPVTYVGFSKEFRNKVNQAMSIKDNQGNVKGIIDREGNVNVRGDDEGGYYDSEGRYINADGSGGGSLMQGMQYLINLKNSGVKLPDNLQQRLLKGINSQALTFKQKQEYATRLGYNSWNDAYKDLSKAVSSDDWWKKDDDAIIPLKETDSSPVVNIDDIQDDGSSPTPDANIDPTSPTYTQENYEQAAGINTGGSDSSGGGISVSDYNNQQAQQAYESAYGSADDYDDDSSGI